MKTSRKIKAYIQITRYEGEGDYYLKTLGEDDEITIMCASALIDDQRLTNAIEVAEEFFNEFGGRIQN